jgi:hypothetical protein
VAAGTACPTSSFDRDSEFAAARLREEDDERRRKKEKGERTAWAVGGQMCAGLQDQQRFFPLIKYKEKVLSPSLNYQRSLVSVLDPENWVSYVPKLSKLLVPCWF